MWGEEVDPNPSSFFPHLWSSQFYHPSIYQVLFTIYDLSKLPPTSDRYYVLPFYRTYDLEWLAISTCFRPFVFSPYPSIPHNYNLDTRDKLFTFYILGTTTPLRPDWAPWWLYILWAPWFYTRNSPQEIVDITIFVVLTSNYICNVNKNSKWIKPKEYRTDNKLQF